MIRHGPCGIRGGGQIWDAIDGAGVSPWGNLSELESLLTDALRGDAGERLRGQRVLTVSGSLHQALVRLEHSKVDIVAALWSRAEDSGGAADPADLAEFLHELAGLARRAGRRDQRLCCWVGV